MKAAVFFKPGQPVSIESVTVRDPNAGEVRVAVKAAGLCHSDVSVIDGTIPYPVPVVLGHEGAGIVEAVGAGVTGVKEGDAVILSTLAHCGRCPACETGRSTECRNAPNPKDRQPFSVGGKPAYQFANVSAFAEYTVVKEQSAIPVDTRVPFDRAALIGCGIMTGVGAVINRAKVETGATMAVFGLGGIGLSCVQGGVLAGASKIIAVDVPRVSQTVPPRCVSADIFGTSTHAQHGQSARSSSIGNVTQLDVLDHGVVRSAAYRPG
jgi:S-(hydroxymethyl)glutathione dehydrogenase/alcohol dehydrogenase